MVWDKKTRSDTAFTLWFRGDDVGRFLHAVTGTPDVVGVVITMTPGT